MKLDEKVHFEWKLLHNGEGKVPNIRLNSANWLYKDFIWMVCGAGSGHGKSSQIWRFSLMEKTWSMVNCTGDGPSCRDGHSGTYIGNGKFVVFGGQGFPEPNNKIDRASDTFKIKTYLKREVYNDLLQFDCDNLSWSPIYPDGLNTPMGRRGHCAVFVGPHQSNTDNQNHADSFDASSYSSNSLMSSSVGTTRSPYSRVHPMPGGYEVPPNSLLVFGGSGIELSKYTEQLYSDLWAFSFVDNSWSKLETTGIEPRPMFDHRMVRVGDVLVVAGGITGVNKTPTPSGVFPTDIMLLNLKTSVWSYMKLWDQYGQPARFNFHGFSLVADSTSFSTGSAATTSLFVFGGNQVVDSRSASTTKGSSWHSAYPEDHTLVLNIQDCTLLPVKCVQDIAPPENRYGHLGISCSDVDVLFNQMLAGSSRDARQGRRLERARTRKNLVDVVPDQQTIEPLMYIYGGAGIDRGGFPDPLLYQLVRVRTEISESFLPPLGGDGVKPDDVVSTATPGSQLDQADPQHRPGSSGGFKMTSRPGSPSSFMDDLSHGNGGNADDEGRRNIWHNLQTKVGHQGEVRAPCNWSEMKLSLTAPFSQRVFETDRFENEDVLDGSRRGSGDMGGANKWGRSAQHNHISSGNFRGTQSAPVNGSMDFLSLDLGGRLQSRASTTRGGLSRSQVLQINTRTNSRTGSVDMSHASASRPYTAPTLTPLAQQHSLFASGTMGGDHHSTTSGDSVLRDRLRQERADRVVQMSAALRPIVRHKTKVAAKEQFLKLFPHHVQAAESM